MPQGLNGLSMETFLSLILDAGAGYLNIDIAALEAGATFEAAVQAAIATAIPIGATRGGLSFASGRQLRQIPADGQMGPTKGLIRRTQVAPVLTVNLLEQTVENLKRQFPGAVVEKAGAWERITGGPITADTYIDNVALITTYGEEGKYIVMLVENALVMESPEFATEDKNEAATEVQFAGTFGAPGSGEPWRVYVPPAASS